MFIKLIYILPSLSTGISDYTTVPCPVGQYCPNATDSPIPCPNGTFRNTTRGRNISDCHLCPAGRFCPLSNSSFWGYECKDGTFCPPGRTAPTVCLAGYFCDKAQTQLPCPAGYYCPKASPAPIPCPEGHYCDPLYNCYNDSIHRDAGACYSKICPLGMYSQFAFTSFVWKCLHVYVYFFYPCFLQSRHLHLEFLFTVFKAVHTVLVFENGTNFSVDINFFSLYFVVKQKRDNL